MTALPGVPPPELPDLVRVEDRLSFLYTERSTLGRDANAVTITDAAGVVHVPAAGLGVLMLGPGTRVTHQAMVLLAENGATVIWVGEFGVRYYAHGRPLAETTGLIESQAKLVSNRSLRLGVARRMYAMRFPEDDDVFTLTMQQLRGREGARVHRCYKDHSERTGVTWGSRKFDPENFDAGDPINKALSVAHSCLYGMVHAVTVALGASPALGFIHSGHSRAFVYDIADLYKAEITIPVAFNVVADRPNDVSSAIRHAVRDAMRSGKILARCVRDIRGLLGSEEPVPETADAQEDYWMQAAEVTLWDEMGESVPGGRNYGETTGPDGQRPGESEVPF
ncbi:type I-E CRISPR-associated endonuclease Cas1e [Glycomyces sp. L485]|uniref:type I-E CRISPR-associated endonuclease Cas1e n=1 Tax=Glycomyces sp. L485 TaxID=2909235 RepID=UPI001F4A2FE5|nr:type I-E CRISPR-associated endonuclease Cas1e [Glycomyces sp. L485]MCH7230514.1 type I-E CRISPR-associated endonuclease Cas1e [Glycomyces sp. L485]